MKPPAPQDQGRLAADREYLVASPSTSVLVAPTLPQLKVARDPRLMREVFQRCLRSLSEESYRIRGCQIARARQHGERYVVLYTLRLEEPDTGRERTQWVTGVMHTRDGEIRQEWEQLQRSGPGQEATLGPTSLAFEPYAFISELGMLVQTFPYDHRLLGLPLLMEGPPPELEPLLLARFGEGEWRAEAWEVEPVRYLPGKRITMRLTARAREEGSGREEARRFYMKLYRKEEEGERTYRTLQALWERAEDFEVGRPVAYLSGLRILVQEEACGTPLREALLLWEEEAAIAAVRGAAGALATLHLHNSVPAPRRRLPWEEEEAATLKKREEVLRRACPRLGPEIGKIVDAVLAGFGEKGPTAPTHGELKPDHIMIDGDRIALIDFDAFSEADPLLDVANVLSLIRIMPLTSSLPQDRAREAAGVFAEEYFAYVPESWRERLLLHYASALIRRAAGLSRRREPGRMLLDEIEALVREAEGSLKAGVWR